MNVLLCFTSASDGNLLCRDISTTKQRQYCSTSFTTSYQDILPTCLWEMLVAAVHAAS